MAAVLSPYTPFMGFQQPSPFYSSFPFNYPTPPPPVANPYYRPQQYPTYSPPQAIRPYQKSAAVYPQPQPQQAPSCPGVQQQAQAYPKLQQQAPAYPKPQQPVNCSRLQQQQQQQQQAPVYPKPPSGQINPPPAPLPLRQQNVVQPRRVPAPPPPPPPPQPQNRTVEYVDAVPGTFRRRQPRIIRQVIKLPTPEPIYRQVRHRMPTPEREVIRRTVIKKANGDIVVRQQQPTRTKSQSRLESNSSRVSSYRHNVHTD
ncbi:unnamed protein product [Adineta ricciae]|uniref:Uncharacterized protein n=1 Tax=Adineta ricciae TaxID=249248 RepID=A0A815EN18_ADIRI|nr:unnamed protein product [Adineta ricciae]